MSSFHAVPITNTAHAAGSALPDAPVVYDSPRWAPVRTGVANLLTTAARAQLRLAQRVGGCAHPAYTSRSPHTAN